MYDSLKDSGIHCVVGYHDSKVAMIAEKLGLPYVTTSLWGGYAGDTMFHMLPKPQQIVDPILDIMTSYKWRTVGVIFEETLGVYGKQHGSLMKTKQ